MDDTTKVIVIGNVCFDYINKGYRIIKNCGGSAFYSSIASSEYTSTGLVSKVGSDFNKEYLNDIHHRKNLNTLGLKVINNQNTTAFFTRYTKEERKMNEIYNYKITNKMFKLDGPLIIAGPCSFATYDEFYYNAKALKDMGITYIRCGAFKPRTSPYSFQGLHEEGMEIAKRVKQELNIKIVAELFNIEQVEKFFDVVDIIQVGSRNMYNYDFLTKLGTVDKPIILKRGFTATIEEWLNAAEYIAKNGNTKIILCERGVRGFDPYTRNILDLQSVVVAKKLCNLPVIVDPSHAGGRRDLVYPMSMAAMACGADGLLIEAHTTPDESQTDSQQTIGLEELKKILLKIKE